MTVAMKGRGIVFLDIDGVLVNRASFRMPRTRCSKFTATHCTAHPTCVENLNRIIAMTGASVVVSSVWRMFGIETMRELFEQWGVEAEIVGVTADLSRPPEEGRVWRSVERGEEIQLWLDTHSEVKSFVILDDDADMAHLSHRLVQTEFEPGLTEADADRAIAILNAPTDLQLDRMFKQVFETKA